jgi:hypothetical protein
MGHLHTLRPFGSRATGNIEEETGFGFQAIGRDVQSLMPFGYLAIGSREKEVGSGFEDIGSITNS